MSQISLKSISGITSITTPAGVDNRFSLYNFDSIERFVLDHSGNLNISGVSTATNFKTGFSNVHSVGFDVVSSAGAGCTIRESGNAVFSGIVTASQFKGDGSQLSGLASREFYGFKAVGEDLMLTTTNSGADNISRTDFESFEDTMTAPSGLSFAINSEGELEMTI